LCRENTKGIQMGCAGRMHRDDVGLCWENAKGVYWVEQSECKGMMLCCAGKMQRDDVVLCRENAKG